MTFIYILFKLTKKVEQTLSKRYCCLKQISRIIIIKMIDEHFDIEHLIRRQLRLSLIYFDSYRR